MDFSDDEVRYLGAMLRHLDKPPGDNRASWIFSGICIPKKEVKIAGELRILVIGANGVGKTCLLKEIHKVHNGNPVDIAAEEHRQIITVDSKNYKVDVLELSFTDTNTIEGLTQLCNAIAMTEAAVLVYDVSDMSSLTYLKAISKTFYDALHHVEATQVKKKTPFPFAISRTTATVSFVPKRPYHFLLLGTKNDVDASNREVSWIEGHKAADEFFGPEGVAAGATVHFMEVSSLTGDRVDNIFPLLTKEVLRCRRELLERQQLKQRLHEQEQRERRQREHRQRLAAQWRPRGGDIGYGAFDDWGCCDFAFGDYDDAGGGGDDGDGDGDDYDYETLMDDANTGGEGSSGDTSSALSGSMRRGWGALKATFSTTFFKKDIK